MSYLNKAKLRNVEYLIFNEITTGVNKSVSVFTLNKNFLNKTKRKYLKKELAC